MTTSDHYQERHNTQSQWVSPELRPLDVECDQQKQRIDNARRYWSAAGCQHHRVVLGRRRDLWSPDRRRRSGLGPRSPPAGHTKLAAGDSVAAVDIPWRDGRSAANDMARVCADQR